MILTPHLIVGATIGAKIHSLWLVIILSLASHFILDKIFHWEYSSGKNSFFRKFRETRDLKSLFMFVGQMIVDALVGLAIVFVSMKIKGLLDTESLKYVLIGCFFSILPDITLGTSFLFKNSTISKNYFIIHNKYLHFKREIEKEGKLTFLGIFTQIIVVVISLLLLFSF